MPRNLVFYHKVCPFSSIWNMLYTQNFAVMMMLVTITVTRTKLVEASQHCCLTNTKLVVPSSTSIEYKNPHLIFGTYWSLSVVHWDHFWTFSVNFSSCSCQYLVSFSNHFFFLLQHKNCVYA